MRILSRLTSCLQTNRGCTVLDTIYLKATKLYRLWNLYTFFSHGNGINQGTVQYVTISIICPTKHITIILFFSFLATASIWRQTIAPTIKIVGAKLVFPTKRQCAVFGSKEIFATTSNLKTYCKIWISVIFFRTSCTYKQRNKIKRCNSKTCL